MSGLLERMAADGHEQLVLASDRTSGLQALIAVHSTALGPALGGVRFWHYRREADAIDDVLRLARGMTYKAAAAGLAQGGGKTVVMLGPERAKPEALLRALGRAVDELGGRYIAAEDVGATSADMQILAEETPWVTGVPVAQGGSGDPSPVTAIGVYHGMRAACREAFGAADLRGRRVAVQGAGHVGAHLVELLVEAGAEVLVADIDAAAVQRLAARCGALAGDPATILAEDCDVLSPCALGAAISAASIPSLRCRVVCGAANNQLADAAAGDLLAERGIVYAPDFVVNAGGIINIAEEFCGYDAERAIERTRGIEQTTTAVFELARERSTTPARAAELYAEERIAAAPSGGRRWRPGSATAWSGGAPLTALRP